MTKITRTVKMKNGITYTTTVEVYDTCEEYYSRNKDQFDKRKIKRIERFLDDLTYIQDHTVDDYDYMKKYREIAEIMKMADEF